MNEFDALKSEVKRFLEFIESEGQIEETGQSYNIVTLYTIFDKDQQTLYNIIANLKKLSM